MITGENIQPLVSVLIPLYNQERYLGTCLRSICNQSYRNLEIVVVNDGSTDKSGVLLEKWAKRDSRIKVVNKPNEGLVKARRDGYRNATGEFVAFVDSDDAMPKRAIEALVRNITEKNVDLVIGSVTRKLGVFTWGNSKSYGCFPTEEVVNQPELYDKYFVGFFGQGCFLVSMWGRLFRKTAIDRALQHTELFPDNIRFMGEDLNFNMRIFPYLNSMYRTDDLVYYYRYGGAVDHFNPHYPELLKLADDRLQLLDELKYENGYAPLFGEYVNMFYFRAQQLIDFKKADKNGVIAYFKQELDERKIIPRLMAFMADGGTSDHAALFMQERDYEGMYNEACKRVRQLHSTWQCNVKAAVLWTLEHLSL